MFKKGQVVLATYGFNKVLNEPFSFLFEFGYTTKSGKCLVYKKGECNMQDAHIFKPEKLSSVEDTSKYFWY